MLSGFAKARALALLVPAALMIGAFGFEFIGGYYPCQMCHWQRWPHDAAILLALFAFAFRNKGVDRLLVWLAGLGILISGLIGIFHAGVEYGWWEGLTTCARTSSGGFSLNDIGKAPIVRCDVAPWSLFGISMAGYNALISVPAALLIFKLLLGKEKA